jgi:hypothetical protein
MVAPQALDPVLGVLANIREGAEALPLSFRASRLHQ